MTALVCACMCSITCQTISYWLALMRRDRQQARDVPISCENRQWRQALAKASKPAKSPSLQPALLLSKVQLQTGSLMCEWEKSCFSLTACIPERKRCQRSPQRWSPCCSQWRLSPAHSNPAGATATVTLRQELLFLLSTTYASLRTPHLSVDFASGHSGIPQISRAAVGGAGAAAGGNPARWEISNTQPAGIVLNPAAVQLQRQEGEKKGENLFWWVHKTFTRNRSSCAFGIWQRANGSQDSCCAWTVQNNDRKNHLSLSQWCTLERYKWDIFKIEAKVVAVCSVWFYF